MSLRAEMNLQQLLMSYFDELDEVLKEVVSSVYSMERQQSDMLRPRVVQQIKDKIDSEVELAFRREGNH